jgi:hypothetical protein
VRDMKNTHTKSALKTLLERLMSKYGDTIKMVVKEIKREGVS